jgi:hypothetical protein
MVDAAPTRGAPHMSRVCHPHCGTVCPPDSVTGPVRAPTALVELATVDGDREDVGDDEDADEAGERDPDVIPDGLLGE